MISYIIYLVALVRLKWRLFLKKRLNRFENYSPDGDLAKVDKIGMIPNETDWQLGTPNLERNENVSIITSNVYNKAALNLNFKWRPNSRLQVTTLLSRLSLELDGKCYDYDDCSTYSPSKSTINPKRIIQYGSNGSRLKLSILSPYRRYRIVFRGYMRARNSLDELIFVRLNFLASMTSKLYDFKEQFDSKQVAQQVATKRPKRGLMGTLEELISHDRHEQNVRLTGEYMIQKAETKEKNTLHLWGFHARQFITEKSQKIRCKRFLGHFNNGRAFHIGLNGTIEDNLDPNEQFDYGFVCFRIGAATGPIQNVQANPIDWTKVNSSSRELSFRIAGQEQEHQVKTNKRESPSEFMELKLGSAPGWGIILINDTLDSAEDLHRVTVNLREYEQKRESGERIDIALINRDKEFSQKPTVVDMDQSDCLYSSLVGAKGASLAQLKVNSKNRGNNYQVPPAIILTRFAYETIQEENPDLKAEITRLEARVGQERGLSSNMRLECERIVSMFETEVKLPAQVNKELGRTLMDHFQLSDLENLDGRSFAVRSSSWGEDEEDMSAAGQLNTMLSVRGYEQLVVAIMRCYASKFGFSNIEYKRQHGLPLDLPMAVVVQEMVECEKAGVLFTCDPTNGDDRLMLITANYGLGESVVSGQTDPDTIKVRVELQAGGLTSDSPSFRVEEVKVGEKKVIMGANSHSDCQSDSVKLVNEEGGERRQEIDPDRSKCCLSEHESIELSKCGNQLIDYFQGGPRDIEWGYKGGQLYLFQSRPVTGLDAFTDFELLHECDMSSRAELEFSTRVNVAEVTPYALTPLDSSYATVKLFPIVSNDFFLKLKKIRSDDYTLDYSSDLQFSTNQLFFSLRSKALFDFSRHGDGKQRSLTSQAMEFGMFGHLVEDEELCEHATEMSEPNQNRFENLRFNWATLKHRFFAPKLSLRCKKQMARLRRDIHSLRFSKSGSSLEGLFEQACVLYRYGKGPFSNHIVCTMLSSKFNLELIQMLSRYIKDPAELYVAFSKVLASSQNVISAEIPHRIDKMARLIGQRGQEEVKIFVEMLPKEGLKYISSDMKCELAVEFDTFMVKFGHRGYNEFEISELAWRETPEKIIEMLQTNVKKYLNVTESSTDVNNKPKTIDEVITNLNVKFSLLDRLRLKYLIGPRCQKFVANREQTKDISIEYLDIMRDAIRLLARALRQHNRIPDEDLIFYMLFEEVKAIVREPQPSIVVQATRRRRMFQQSFKQPWRYDEIIKGYEAIPFHLRQTTDLDENLAKAQKLVGTTANCGRVRGRVCFVDGYDEINNVRAGDILLAYSTDIAFSPVFPLVSGVITEIGGLVSHGAVVAREYGLPSVIGVNNVTKILKHGEEIILDADNGTIIRLNHESISIE